jgi:ParB/RepB/Spo0J family partition protein
MTTVDDNDKLIDECLRAALGGSSSLGTWKVHQQEGLTNQELQALIGRLWGLGGSSTFPAWYSYKGGKNPRFWLDKINPPEGKPTLGGMALVKRVRVLLEIPQPDELEIVRFVREEGPVTPQALMREMEAAEGESDPAEAEPGPAEVSPRNSEAPSETEELYPPRIQWADLDIISPNPYQPRKSMDRKGLESLARGIRIKRRELTDTGGLLQVPVGREHVGRIQLAFGHRRLSAFLLNREEYPDEDWSRMPVRILEMDDETMADYAARENADREELNDIEKGEAIKMLMDEFEWTLEKAASAHGVSKSQGSKLVSLLDLPKEIQQLLIETDESGRPRLGQSHARELLRLCLVEPPMIQRAIALAQDTVANSPTREQLASRVTSLIEEQRVKLATEAKLKTLTCYKCGGSLELSGSGSGWVNCTGCKERWIGLAVFEASLKRSKQRETRYCRHCKTPREFDGNELFHGNTVACGNCSKAESVFRWSKEPPQEPVYRPLFPNGAPQEGASPSPKCARCNSPTSRGFQVTRPDKGWTRVMEGDQETFYCTDCAWRHYEELPCPGCGGKVYYAKMLQGLACEGCNRRWDFTAAFRDEVVKKAEAPAKRRGDKWSSVTYGGEWVCELCDQKQDRNRTKVIALLEGEEGPRQVCHACSVDRLILDYPTCYVCKKGVVHRDRGYIRCTDCGNQWGSMAKFYADRVVEGSQIEEVRKPAGEFDCPKCHQEKIVKINGVAECLGCGVRWMNPDDFHKERLIPSQSRNWLPKMACPKCQGFHLKHTGNFHHCFTCKHEWNTPGFGAEQRRAALHKRAEKLAAIINQCAIDALYQLESWFDQVEAAFPPAPKLFPEKSPEVALDDEAWSEGPEEPEIIIDPTGELVEKAAKINSCQSLDKDRLKGVIEIEGKTYACTGSMGAGDGRTWARAYLLEVVPLESYKGKVYTHEDVMASGVTGLAYYTGRVGIYKDQDWVLTDREVTLRRPEPTPTAP